MKAAELSMFKTIQILIEEDKFTRYSVMANHEAP
jgi:hypothetical protein